MSSIPAAIFQPPPMSCPGCHSVLPKAGEQCPHCGYTGWTCAERFPYEAPPLERYIDYENRLSAADRVLLDRAIEALESALPQVRVHVCVVRLPPDRDARECGFWMLNASVPRDETEAAHRPWSVLLLIDRTACAASVTTGYGLEPFVSNEALSAALECGRSDFSGGAFAQGAVRILKTLRQSLTAAAREAIRTAARYQRGARASSPSRPASQPDAVT